MPQNGGMDTLPWFKNPKAQKGREDMKQLEFS